MIINTSMIAAMACICACTKEDPTVQSFEGKMANLYGNYHMADIHWCGLAVNLNYDVYAYWGLLHEFKNKAGYYEPD